MDRSATHDTSTWRRVATLLRCLPELSCEFESDGSDSIAVSCHTVLVHPVYRAASRTCDPNDLAAWRARLRALELLALAWLVDLDGWMYLMEQQKVWTTSSPLRRSRGKLVPTFVIQFGRNESAEFIVQVLELLLSWASYQGDGSEDEETAAFMEARDVLLAMSSDVAAAEAWDWNACQIPVRIKEGDDACVDPEVLASWVHSERVAASRFHFVGVDIVKYDLQAVGPEFIQRVSSLVAHGVPLHHVKFGVLEGGASAPRSELGQLITALTGPLGPAELECSQMNQRIASEAFLSALASPPVEEAVARLRSIGMIMLWQDDAPTARRVSLLWNMFALFSQHGRHTIGSVEVLAFTEVSTAELEWFTDILQPTRAAPRLELLIAEVVDEHATREPPVSERYVSVPRGCAIRLEERDDWRDHSALRFNGDEPQRFRVIRDDAASAFIDVLVPGYGRCGVERSESIQLEELPSAPWRFGQHSVRTMTFGMFYVNAEEQQVVTLLLALVGAPVQQLCFKSWLPYGHSAEEGLTKSVLLAIVRSCPQLSSLSLGRMSCASADALVDTYEAEPTTQLAALDLGERPFVDPNELALFLETLRDTSYRITRTLRELAVDLVAPGPDGNSIEDDDASHALLRMLDSNELLLLVHVRLSRGQYERIGHKLRAHHRRRLPVQKAPLHVRAKCAFLSAVRKATLANGDAFSRVFAFAAECETRAVSVNITEPL